LRVAASRILRRTDFTMISDCTGRLKGNGRSHALAMGSLDFLFPQSGQ
jgi:hypothetical protein